MADLIRWARDRKKNLENITDTAVRGVSRTIDQVNPLDNGRTWQQRTPTNTRSLIGQTTHNGATNLVGNAVAKPLIRTSMAINQGFGNAALALGGRKTQNAQEYTAGTGIPNLQKFTDYKGTKQQITGDAITNTANVAMPGSSKLVTSAVKNVLPKAVPKLASRTIANAGVGATGGAVGNVGAELSENRIHSVRDLTNAARTGAQFGAVLGAGGTLAAPVVNAGVNRAIRQAPQAATTIKRAANPVNAQIDDHIAMLEQSKQGKPLATQRQIDRAIQQTIAERARINAKGGVGGEGLQLPKTSLNNTRPSLPQSALPSNPANVARVSSRGSIPGEPNKDLIRQLKDEQDFLSNPNVRGGVRANSERKIRQLQAQLAQPRQAAKQTPVQGAGLQQTILQPPRRGNAHAFSLIPADSLSQPQVPQVPRSITPRPLLNSGSSLPTSIAPNAEANVFAQNPLVSINQHVSRTDLHKGQTPQRLRPPTEITAVEPALPRVSKRQSQALSQDAPLPERNTNKVKLLDKLWRSNRSIIERQGASGRQLAGMLQTARDRQELHLAGIEKELPTLMKLARGGGLSNKQFENFIDATQGNAKPASAKIAQAIKEWQATHPMIRQRAVEAGLDVGDLGPNYYPHFIDYDKVFNDTNTYNKALNHLVKTGQAPNQDEAIRLLQYARDVSRNREFGNLEASRIVDLPFYDRTPNSLISYLNGSTKRISNTEIFGAKDENALQLIKKIGLEGGDTEAAKNAFDISVGAKNYSAETEKWSRRARQFTTTTKLGLGALTNLSQSVNTGIVTGHLRTLGAAVKQLNPETREYVRSTGVISDALLNDLRAQKGDSFSEKVLGRTLQKITAPGFGAVEKFNRSIAATAGRDYALRLAQRGDEATLRKLGVTGTIKGNTLTEAQQIQAARKVVEKTQFKVDAQDLPGWTDSPGGKLVSQFRTFSYNQSKFFSNEILKPLRHGNFLPLSRVLAALPVGYALYETRRMIDGRPEEENPIKVGLQSFGKIGGAGLVLDLYQGINPPGSQYLPSDRRYTMAAGTLGGPTIATVGQGVGAISDAVQRKNTPEDQSRLEGKVAVANTDDKYTDLTSLSRFGLQQVPIVGSPIKNRVLPYKKESEADTGKATASDSSTMSQDQKVKQAFASPEAKEFLKLSPADRQALAATDPDARALYDELQAIKRVTKAPPLRPVGLDANYAKQQLGLDNFDPTKILNRYARLSDNGKEKAFEKNNSAEFEYKVASYLQDKKSGKITEVEDIKKQNELAKLMVGKDFDRTARTLHALSKTQLYNYITTNPNGQKLADQIIAYDDALTAAGVQSKNKFRLKDGTIDFDPASGGSGSGGGKRKAIPKDALAAAIDVPSVAKVRQAQISARAPAKRNFKRARPQIPKVASRQHQLVVKKA